MSFEFEIKITTCAECPHVVNMPWGYDCSFNNGDRAFADMKDADTKISPDCPYRIPRIVP